MVSTIERREIIVKETHSLGSVSVNKLSQRFRVSSVTIRNDLNSLDNSGLLIRTRGGAVAPSKITRELSFQEKHKKHQRIKRRLGQEAAKLIQPGDSIILDSGTTSEEVTRSLAGIKDLAVMTNGLNIASALADVDGIDVMITGGSLRKKSMSFYGRQAEESLTYMRFDKIILGADGFDMKGGITTYFEPEASLNRIMCKISKQIIVVTDSSKFDHCESHIISPCVDIDVLITDSGIPDHYVKALEAADVDVRIVDVQISDN